MKENKGISYHQTHFKTLLLKDSQKIGKNNKGKQALEMKKEQKKC
jgi:hypothetical protein